jgi:hypothetical protein
MACCGKKREQLLQANRANRILRAGENLDQQVTPAADVQVYFQYTGRTGLTVIGRATYQRYRFDRTGVVLNVDARDKRALSAIPTLRQVKKPNSG